MSMQRHVGPKLPGLAGPLYPDLVTELVRALDARKTGWSGNILTEVASRVPGYEHHHYRNETPADRRKDAGTPNEYYVWFWVLVFRVPGGEVHIAIPWAQDWDGADGTKMDRSPAVYTSGRRVGEDAVRSAVARFICALRAN